MGKILLITICLLATLFGLNAQTPGNCLRYNEPTNTRTVSPVLPAYWGSYVGKNSFTVEMWVKTEITDLNTRQSLFLAATNNTSRYTQLILENGQISALVRGWPSGSPYSVKYACSAAIPDIRNQWTHIAYTFNAESNKINIYVNGEKTTSGASEVNELGMGYANAFIVGTEYFVGCIDEVHIWNCELSPCQINAGMNSDYTLPTPTGLMTIYNFNQGIAGGNNTSITSVLDLKQTYHLTMVNFSLTGTVENFLASTAPITKRNVNPADNTPEVTENGGSLIATLSGASYQWIDVANGNSNIDGANSQSYSPSANGIYAVQITKDGCTQQSPTINFVATSIHENSNSKVNVYSKPSGEITINLGDTTGDVWVEVTSLTGAVVHKFPISNQPAYRFNINQPAGLYFVTIKSGNTTISTHKIIKQ